MTTEEIIAVAEGVGLHYYVNEMAGSYVERLERFAAVVSSIEQEACAKVCERMWHKWLDSPEENETNIPDAEDCAKAIRAKANAEMGNT